MATSSEATVGSPDALGGAANFVGSVRFAVKPGAPGEPEDSDVGLNASLVDVRCRPTGSRCGTANTGGPADYTGEVRARVELTITDRWNASAPGGGTDPGTGHLDLGFTFACLETVSTSTGSTCTVTTSAQALVSGMVLDSKRAVWGMGQVRVYDGGPDGDGDTIEDNGLFATQGVFVP